MIYRRRLSMLSSHGSLLTHRSTARSDEREREKRNTMTLQKEYDKSIKQ